jgi:hypothetical protein
MSAKLLLLNPGIQLTPRGSSPDWDIEDETRPLPHESSPHSTHYGSPKFDEFGSDNPIESDDEGGIKPSRNPNLASRWTADAIENTIALDPITHSAPPSSARGVKRKSFADSITETSALERASRIQVANAQIAAKNLRTTHALRGKLERESLKQKRLERVELARLSHERDEAIARRAHDVMMFEKQAQLEMIRAGHVAPVVDPSLL